MMNKEDYFLNKTADSGYGDESLIRLVHECSDHKFYYLKQSRPITWDRGIPHLIDGHDEFKVVDKFVLQDDLNHPNEMDYLWDIILCPYCGRKFGEDDKNE